jgi:hypothetical protein
MHDARHKTGVIARLDRAIQYAAASPDIAAVSGILDSPLSRGMTAEVEVRVAPNATVPYEN